MDEPSPKLAEAEAASIVAQKMCAALLEMFPGAVIVLLLSDSLPVSAVVTSGVAVPDGSPRDSESALEVRLREVAPAAVLNWAVQNAAEAKPGPGESVH